MPPAHSPRNRVGMLVDPVADRPAATRVAGVNPADGRPMQVDVRDGKVHAVHLERHGTADPTDAGWLAPGLVDLQVNGYGGHDVNGEALAPQTVHDLAQALLRVGVTTFLPTLITACEQQLTATLVAIQEARRLYPIVAHMVPYVHVEGPAIEPANGPRGAHPLAHVRPPNLEEFARWQAASGNVVGMVTMSPHWPQTVDYITGLTSLGIHVALGHTQANAEQINAAVAAGARLSTHLGNGSHAQMHRRHNALWPQLANDALCAAFIADGHHLSADQLKVMVRAKGLERSLIVSDATALGGMAAGHYQASVGGPVILAANGHLTMDDGTGQYLAGAALPLIAGLSTLVRHAGLQLADAITLATTHPGRWVGGRGTLQVGADADLVRFEWDGEAPVPQVTGVWLRGQQVVGA